MVPPADSPAESLLPRTDPASSREPHLVEEVDVYAVRMLGERLQVLVSREQRQRLESEAVRRNASVGSLVREAIDARYGVVTREERVCAVEEIAAMRGTFLEPEELARVIDEEQLAATLPPGR